MYGGVDTKSIGSILCQLWQEVIILSFVHLPSRPKGNYIPLEEVLIRQFFSKVTE
jgi:hypothetical protein